LSLVPEPGRCGGTKEKLHSTWVGSRSEVSSVSVFCF
jgi:hypothetical protein